MLKIIILEILFKIYKDKRIIVFFSADFSWNLVELSFGHTVGLHNIL